MATMSILGLYNWDDTIFEGFTPPTLFEKDVYINSILLECAELEFLYPNPEFAKSAIALWSKTREAAWQKLADTTTFEYNPIENYNRVESWTDERTNTGNRTASRTNSSNQTTNTELSATGTTESESESTRDVYGFNGAAGGGLGSSPAEKTAGTQSDSSNSTSNSKVTGSGSGSESSSEENSGNETSTHTGNVAGNVGTTTTQQMIEEERRVVTFDLVAYVVRDFKERFCILVY